MLVKTNCVSLRQGVDLTLEMVVCGNANDPPDTGEKEIPWAGKTQKAFGKDMLAQDTPLSPESTDPHPL